MSHGILEKLDKLKVKPREPVEEPKTGDGGEAAETEGSGWQRLLNRLRTERLGKQQTRLKLDVD